MMQEGLAFTLPRGYVDQWGQRHQQGWMRLASAADEIEPQGDMRAAGNPAYLSILVLERVVERIGTITNVSAELLASLSASDFLYLQDVYLHLNAVEPSVFQTACPFCTNLFEIQIPRLVNV